MIIHTHTLHVCQKKRCYSGHELLLLAFGARYLACEPVSGSAPASAVGKVDPKRRSPVTARLGRGLKDIQRPSRFQGRPTAGFGEPRARRPCLPRVRTPSARLRTRAVHLSDDGGRYGRSPGPVEIVMLSSVWPPLPWVATDRAVRNDKYPVTTGPVPLTLEWWTALCLAGYLKIRYFTNCLMDVLQSKKKKKKSDKHVWIELFF